MNSEELAQPNRRGYHSQVRTVQKAQTRQRILETVAAKMAQGSFDSLSMEQIAAAADVGPATLYRHFASREELLDGLSHYFNETMGEPELPRTPDEVVEITRRSFKTFDQNPDLVRAFFVTGLGRSARSRGRARRIKAIRESLQPVTATLPEPRRTEAEAIIAYLVSLQTWLTITQEFGLKGEQVGEAVAWAIRTLLADLGHAPEVQSVLSEDSEDRGGNDG